MNPSKRIEAVNFLRKLPGGSQSILVEASDGLLYVAKFMNNPQGPNLLLNEAMGSELYRSAGLPVPEWRTVHLSEGFLAGNPGCWMEGVHGPRKPRAGCCFGSRYLGLSPSPVFEILAGEHFSRLRNRMNFWVAWVLDVLCDHTDNRQAIFLEGSGHWLEAYFIDYGQMFGGAKGTVRSHYRASRYLDRRVYPETSGSGASEVEAAVRGLDLEGLARTALSLPQEWQSSTALARLQTFMQRVRDRGMLRKTIRFLMEEADAEHGMQLAQVGIGTGRPHLLAPLLPIRGVSRACGWASDPVRGQGRKLPAAVYTPWLEAANIG